MTVMFAETVPWELPYATRATRLCDINTVLADFAEAVETSLDGLQTTTDRIVTIPYTSISNGADEVLTGPGPFPVTDEYMPFDTVRADTRDGAVLTATPSGINTPDNGFWMSGFMFSCQSAPQIAASCFQITPVYDRGIYGETLVREAFPSDNCHLSYSEIRDFSPPDVATTLSGYSKIVTPAEPPPVTITAIRNSSLYIFWLADD